jgi:hypothetical protein
MVINTVPCDLFVTLPMFHPLTPVILVNSVDPQYEEVLSRLARLESMISAPASAAPGRDSNSVAVDSALGALSSSPCASPAPSLNNSESVHSALVGAATMPAVSGAVGDDGSVSGSIRSADPAAAAEAGQTPLSAITDGSPGSLNPNDVSCSTGTGVALDSPGGDRYVTAGSPGAASVQSLATSATAAAPPAQPVLEKFPSELVRAAASPGSDDDVSITTTGNIR